MYMYVNNPYLPNVRMLAVRMYWQKQGGVRKIARHVGVYPSTVSRWIKKDKSFGHNPIPTLKSEPKNHPNELKAEIVQAIVNQRLKRNRCAQVIHQELINQNIKVSLVSVKRTLKRQGLIRKRSPWKKWHFSEPRPEAINAGDLVQIDTIHIQPLIGKRFYIYTLIDVASRWAYAEVTRKISATRSFHFAQRAQRKAGFKFNMIQSDYGPEFSIWFTKLIRLSGSDHRHSRVRKANDNSHIERFNRTLQEECFKSEFITQKLINDYLKYYNNKRLHMGINFQTPLQVLRRC